MTPSIYIAIPTCRDWKSAFGMSLAMMMHNLTIMQAKGEISGLYLNCSISSLLPYGRQKMLNDALSKNYTHILWLDDDIKFPSDTVEVLLKHKLPIIGANIVKKETPITGVAQDLDGRNIISGTGIEKVKYGSMGLMLMELGAVRTTYAPHFEIIWLEERGDYLGEDLYFQEKLKLSGHDIWIDHELSYKCSHVGDYKYKF